MINELSGVVLNGRFSLEDNLNRLLKIHNGKKVIITIKEIKRKRSNNQNAYYWGVVIPMIVEMLHGYGNVVSSEQAHNFLANEVGKLHKNILMGNVVKTVLKSTTELSTIEFEDYMEKIRAFASEHEVFIPLPNECLGE